MRVHQDIEVVFDIEHARGNGRHDQSEDQGARHWRVCEGHFGILVLILVRLTCWDCGIATAHLLEM